MNWRTAYLTLLAAMLAGAIIGSALPSIKRALAPTEIPYCPSDPKECQ